MGSSLPEIIYENEVENYGRYRIEEKQYFEQ